MEPGQPHVLGHQQPPPDQRLDIEQTHLQLVDIVRLTESSARGLVRHSASERTSGRRGLLTPLTRRRPGDRSPRRLHEVAELDTIGSPLAQQRPVVVDPESSKDT